MKVLIVDSSEAFANAISNALSHTFETEVCCDGPSALKMAHTFSPDILVLDTILPGNDGFYILQTMHTLGLRPLVLMVTPLLSEYVLQRAQQLRVHYMMCKPCNLQALVSCINVFADKLEGKERNTDAYTLEAKRLLNLLNFHTNLSGYQYLLEALIQLRENMRQSLTKELYPAVAKESGSTWQQVEHAIRIAINDAWKSRDESVWNLYFPQGNNEDNAKPTNWKFLSRLAECLSQEDTYIEEKQI